MDVDLAIRLVGDYIDRGLSEKRRAHSLGVAALAGELACRHGIDPGKAYLAGLAHDMAKGKPREVLEDIVGGGKLAPDSPYRGDPAFLHGPAAAVMLERDFGVDDAEVLEAVRAHTIGEPGMGRLAALVYCADKIEPGRAHSNPALLEGYRGMELEHMLAAVVGDLIAYLGREGFPVAPQTLSLYNSLKVRE
jgi:predicted HD superfamily hydrolase involved in NAD metabolism